MASALVLSTVLLLVKFSGERNLALPEVMFWRQVLPVLCVVAWLAGHGQLARLKTARLAIHGRRAVLGAITTACVFASARLLPLSEATVLTFATPLLAVMFSAWLLREHVGPFRWSAVALGLAGVLVIIGFDTANLSPLGTTVGIVGAVGGALVTIQVRQLAHTEESLTVVFWFSLFSALMFAPGALVYGTAHTSADWLLLMGIGLSGLVFQVLATAALRFGSVSSVLVMDYSQLVWATIYGWVIFATLPSAATWIGAPAIIAAGLIVAWREHRLSRRTAPARA